jgi:hypothetical protein
MASYTIHGQYPGEVRGNDFFISKPTAERAVQSAIHKFLKWSVLDERLNSGGELVIRIKQKANV